MEIETAGRYCQLNWIPVCVTTAALACLLPAYGFSLDPWSVGVTFAVSAGFVALARIAAKSSHRFHWNMFFGLCALAQMIQITATVTPLTYVAAALKMPMQDDFLGHIDRAIGFDAERYIALVGSNEFVANLLNFGYGMIAWPVFGIPIILAATGRFVRLQQFLFAFMTSLIFVTLVSAVMPAFGTYHHWGIDLARYPHVNPGVYLAYLQDIGQTIAGARRHLDLLNLQGLVTFPSFHATCAILYFWALQPVRFFGPLALICNALMLAATPTVGGHYLIDVIVGVVVAIASLRLAAKFSAERPRPVPARPLAQQVAQT